VDTIQNLLTDLQTLKDARDDQGINKLLSDDVLQYHNNAEVYIYKSSACIAINDFEHALSYAQRAVVLERGNKKAHFQRGIALYMLKDHQAAIKDFSTVLKSDIHDKNAILMRAMCWTDISNYKKAIEDYSSAILIDSNDGLLYYERGLCRNKVFEFEKAIEDFDKAVEINEAYYQAYCDKGLACFALQRYDEALKNYNKCLQFDKTYSVAYYNKGLFYHRDKDHDKAIENYTNALVNHRVSSLVDIRAFAYNNRGNVYMIKQLYDLAIADINNALAIDPAQGAAYLNRGIIMQQILSYNKAKENFVKALGILQTNEEANKTYLNFLEEQIKMCDEKISETDKLRSVKATKKDKKTFEDTTKKLDELIDDISKAARSDVKAVVHYTKLFVADIYLDKATSKMNYSNAIYMNDPTEGTTLLNYMNNSDIKKAFERGEKLTEQSVYLGSFLPAEDGVIERGHNDELIMWRTYGRDGDGNEACGCSIIIDSKFFSPPVSTGQPVTGENADMLCKVIYIKNRANEQKLLADKESGIEAAIAKFKDKLLDLIKLKRTSNSKNEFSALIDKMVFKKYSKIAYLFKSADYEYEHEVRVMKYVPRNSDTIKCYPIESKGKPGRLFVESVNPVFPFIQKIYLGPKVQDSPHWSLYLDYQVKQRQNEYKLNKTQAHGSETTVIKIVKSERKFV
jgi:tetratricopeptide (TPR) repeat protein